MPLTKEENDYINVCVGMVREKNRVSSFKSWVFDDDKKCCPAKLAEAGFIFIGSADDPDSVQCFLCGKSLDGWEESDDPWTEHLNHASHCKFANLRKPERLLTVGQILDFHEQVLKDSMDKIFGQKIKNILETQKLVRKKLMNLK